MAYKYIYIKYTQFRRCKINKKGIFSTSALTSAKNYWGILNFIQAPLLRQLLHLQQLLTLETGIIHLHRYQMRRFVTFLFLKKSRYKLMPALLDKGKMAEFLGYR
jgi:hypothetical protein